jgi:hypothetical protein
VAFETTRQEIIKQAIALNTLWKQTRDQKYRDEELRLRRIALDLENTVIGGGGSGVTQIVAGTGVTISPAGGTGNVTINATATTPDLQDVTDEGNTTTNVIDIGGAISDYYRLDTAATPTPVQGMMFWDSDRSTVDVQLDVDVSAKIGQDNFWYVKNQSGATIPKGKAVMAVGTLGASGRILIDEMVANGSISSKFLLGVTAEDIANGADGFVMNIGKLRQVNTAIWPDGTVLYCDPTTPGNLTSTKPSSPNLALPVAFVVHSAANGVLAIRVSTLDENAFNTPTLAQVTTAGNTTTNAITVGGLTVATNLIYTDTVNGRVGIGTTGLVPGILLTINGSVSIPGGQSLKLDPSANIYIVAASSQFRVYTGAIAALSIPNTGNVLIGTSTDAGYKLDVNGDIRSARLYANVIRDSNGNNIVSTSVLNITNTDTTVGTGTSTPAYKLQVQGTVSAQLTNATHADQVYYNSATGELTYGTAAGGSTPTLDQVTTAGNTTTNAITVDKLTINNGTYNASIGFGLINSPTANYFDVFFANNTGLRFGSPSFDGSAFQAFGGLHASYPGQMYFDYGSQQRTVANRSANFRNASSPSPVTVMKLTNTSNVLIGTTTDSGYKLDVNGTIRSNNVITASGGNSTDWNTAFGWGDHAAAGYITGTTGFTGVFTIPTNPPGQQNLDIQNGLIINVF